MTRSPGSLGKIHNNYYARLNLYDELGNRYPKNVPLHIPATPGHKKEADNAFRRVLSEYENVHITVSSGKAEQPTENVILFCDYVKEWLKADRKNSYPQHNGCLRMCHFQADKSVQIG